MKSFYLLLCLFHTKIVYGWGADGHRLVGYIAEAFLKDHSSRIIQSELGSETLADVGPWGDVIRSNPNFKWANPLHYVDVHDTPGKSCGGYIDERDCPNGHCLIGAITNFTQQLMCNGRASELDSFELEKDESEIESDSESDSESELNWSRRHSYGDHDERPIRLSQRSLAIRFVDHFIGDLTQPLHVCGRDRGGNTDHVVFGNQHTLNFHKLWDSSLYILFYPIIN